MSSTGSQWQHTVQEFLSDAENPLLVVLGPTASGKTGFSIQLAGWISDECKRGVEIVNADSRQLYTAFDIGTGKIMQSEMRGIPHHLVDVLDPKEEAKAGEYKKRAEQVIDAIHTRGNVPMLVGGSMLYLSAVIDDLTMGSPGDPNVRMKLEEEYDRDHGAALHERLSTLNPEIAAKTDRRNKPRLIRAVELALEPVPRTELRSSKNSEKYDLCIFGMEVLRDVLIKRIDARIDDMIKAGWIDEVRGLLSRGYGPTDPAFKSVGYKEIVEYLETGDPASLAELSEIIKAKTRQYARRQMQWWKGDSRIQWIEP